MKKYAVIVAGGSGQRMGASIPKQFLLLQGKPLLWYSLNVFLRAFDDLQIILVVPGDHLLEGERLAKELDGDTRIKVITGGSTRFDSVKNGLACITSPSIVFVHDGVRCLVSQELIRRCYAQALGKGSAIPAVAATDSIRVVEGAGHFVMDRNRVLIIQTPQTFQSELLLPAFQRDYADGFTDEATVVEASGKEVFIIEGEYTNIKITRPVDLLVAERILADRSSL